MTAGSTWYVAQCSTPLIKTASYFIDRAGFRYADPFITEPVTRRQQRAFPGYLLIQFDVDRDPWQEINRIPGVVHLLPKLREQPIALPPGFVDDLNDRIAEGENAVEDLMHRYAKGDRVSLTNGPFADHSGAFAGLGPKGRTFMIEIMLFRRATLIEALPSQVRTAAE